MTIVDNTVLHLSQPFTKTWRLRNAGTCTWTTGYKLSLAGGDRLNAANSVPMPYNVGPGQTVDLSVDMTAPGSAGHYEGYWQLQSPDGRTFGVGSLGTDNIWVRIRVIAPAYSTETPHSTGMSTMAVTPTVPTRPSATAAGPEVIYDFATNMCAAQWQSNTGVLPCPGKDGDPSGFVLSLTHAQLEDGTTTSLPSILTFPHDSADGYILGIYPEQQMQTGDHFQASVACEYGATACSVLFRVSYLDQASKPHDLWALGEFYDGKYFNLDLDLTPLAGQTVKLILYVNSLGSATGDRALWIAPRIVHLPEEQPTATSTLVPVSSATPSPAPHATPTPMPAATSAPVPTPIPASQPSPVQQVLDALISFFQQLFGAK